VILKLDRSTIPGDVKTIQITLSREGYNSIVGTEDVSQQTVLEIAFNTLDVGTWRLNANAMNDSSVVIYSGSAEVEVIEDQTTIVNLTLKRVPGRTGNILLIINWQMEGEYTDYIDNPILSRTGNDIDRFGVYESMVYKFGGEYQMWFTGYRGDDTSYIFHANSFDGYTWQRITYSPVIYPGKTGEWDEQSVTAGPVIKKDDMYLIYYHGRKSRLGQWHTGLATSQDGLVWEKYNNPVLYGEEDSWDYRVSANHVEKVGDKYYMYYTGISLEGSYNIGLTMSDDGLTWTKYSGNPVLTVNQAWEGLGVYWSTVYKTGNSYRMIYMNKNGNVSGFGEAISYDGITWAKNYDAPVFTNLNTTNNWDLILYPHAVVNGNELILYYSGYFASLNEKFICFATKPLE
jgi:predicted GH43/DUF377 family glycosyl hydrolase